MTHRELADGWLAALAASGLPLPHAEGSRPRSPLSFAAPLPIGVPAERELADLLLAERMPIGDVRELLVPTLPESVELTGLHDVWLGAAPLPASLAAADYRVRLASDVSAIDLTLAAAELLAAETLPRQRARGGSQVSYDLRPLVDAVKVQPPLPDAPDPRAAEANDPAPAEAVLLIRTLFDSARGMGRPEEVVAALADVLGRGIEMGGVVRERLLLVDEL
jgi:radical SAM-linked protein